MAKRQAYDWDAIKRDYRTGQFSDAELARKHGCSRTAIQKKRKAEPDEWKRDLSKKVKERTRQQLLQAECSSEVAPSHVQEGGEVSPEELDKQQVEVAAAARVQVVLSHRRTLSDLKLTTEVALAELRSTMRAREDIEVDIIADTANDSDGRRRNRMLAAVALSSNSGVLRDVAAAMERIIKLERQAFNLDDERTEDEDALTTLIKTVREKSVHLVDAARQAAKEAGID